jgi:potassium-dependent mechanosensitive channel
LWAVFFFKLFMEWRWYLKTTILDSSEEADRTGQSIRWLILQLLWLVWFFSVVLSVLLAWGGKQTVIVGFIHLLNYPVTIGNIHFSIMNFIYAFLILVVTQSLTRFWKFILKKKILAGSGLETGLQDSITMITIYTFWVFGILLSLHAFGLGTTSMALAFGALGIGLGFGLQNIFNNFISGIILLFERPIQVGDDVEINGVWATVKKINVRATVVQTYDNASLIIPNSEFISSQVTNWSFKDKRIRRNIDVGVAYGSNIELVREILLEIADNTPRVFKSPKPDVVFRDFGDSALVFRLRVWTDIDNIFKVETAIRFAIDRRFNESGIVIAFPQRDVHVYNENKESTGI